MADAVPLPACRDPRQGLRMELVLATQDLPSHHFRPSSYGAGAGGEYVVSQGADHIQLLLHLRSHGEKWHIMESSSSKGLIKQSTPVIKGSGSKHSSVAGDIIGPSLLNPTHRWRSDSSSVRTRRLQCQCPVRAWVIGEGGEPSLTPDPCAAALFAEAADEGHYRGDLRRRVCADWDGAACRRRS